jgi:hypothetical protein
MTPRWEDLTTRNMSTRQFLGALDELGLTTASQRTARAIGVSVRRCQRYAAGDASVPNPIARILALYLTHGLPPDVRDDPDVENPLKVTAPNGLKLADCTGAECRKFGGLYTEIGEAVSANKTVGEQLTKEEAQRLWREAYTSMKKEKRK